MSRNTLNIALLCTLLIPAVAWSGASEGGAFRLPGYGARAWAMGGAAVATLDDESSIYWNPALLSGVNSNMAGASYINLVEGTTARQSELAYVHILSPRYDESGLPVHRHVFGAMYTNVTLDISGGESYSENHVRLAYAYTPEDLITFAVTMRAFFSTSGIDNFGAFGTSVDGSARMRLSQDVTFALVARDAFSRYSYDYADGRNFDLQLQRGYTLGLGYKRIPHVALEGDLVFANDGVARSVVGAESDYILEHLALRSGMAHLRSGDTRVIPYLGFGLRASRLTIHYNANLDSEDALGSTHRFSLSVTL